MGKSFTLLLALCAFLLTAAWADDLPQGTDGMATKNGSIIKSTAYFSKQSLDKLLKAHPRTSILKLEAAEGRILVRGEGATRNEAKRFLVAFQKMVGVGFEWEKAPMRMHLTGKTAFRLIGTPK